MSLRRKSVVAVMIMVAALVPAGAASAGSVSSGALTLTIKDAPFFVKGVQEGLFDYCGDGFPVYEGATLQQALSATSSYGIKSWDVATSYSYDYPGPWTHYAQSAAPLIRYGKDNYNDDCGGGVHNGQGVIVRVTDNHGNVAELEEMERFYLQRWDNTNVDNSFPGSWSFGAAWATNSSCAQCDNNSTAYATKAGASAVFTLTGAWSANGNPPPAAAHLGLVMTKGPGHGAVRLYLDGVLKATIDTKAATYRYRQYVYDFGPLAPGAHTVKLVNVGTSGRPRIDVQGMGLVIGSTDVPLCDPDTCF